MKTLLFCTAYADSQDAWNKRYKVWFEYYQACGIKYDKILIFDDASPVRPEFLPEENYYRFDDHIGRPSHLDYGGWYRSFSTAVRYAKNNGFDKIVHAESDAYFLSRQIIDFVNSLDSGWHSMWCAKHNFNESALQIICPDQIESYYRFTDFPYDEYRNKLIDNMFPYTNVYKFFKGDRFGEYMDHIPIDADYSCQTRPHMIKEYLDKKS